MPLPPPSTATADRGDATPADERVSGLLDALDQAASGEASATGRRGAEAPIQDRLVAARLGVASSLFTALRWKHAPTAAHSLRVALAATKWAAVLKMPDPLRTQFEVAALLHDVGKLGVPDAVLVKPGRLLPNEVELFDQHPEIGAGILRSAGAPKAVIDTVLASAAWHDGSHRRVRLRGDDIPVFARMLSIVDAFDSMTTDHVYRPARSRERALAELYEFAGRQFDPALVASFSQHFEHDQRALEEDVARRWLSGATADALPWNPAGTGFAPSASAPPAADRMRLFEQKLIDNMHDGVVFVDAQSRVLLWNTGAERLTGVAANAALGQVLKPSLLEMASRDGSLVQDQDCPIAQSVATGLQRMESVTVIGRTGRHVAVDLHAVPVRSGEGASHGATVLLHDASSKASLEEKCQALHVETTKDPLTQVANRAEFDRMLAAFVDAHEETALPCSLIMADIDHFKSVNDNYGHQAGDQVIVSFATLLKSMCRSGDLVARYGGEEFAVLCADCNNAGAARRAEELRKALCEIQHSELGNKTISASFGVTQLQTGDTPDTMLRRADRALLMAKDQGRNQVVQLGDGMTEQAEKKSWWPFGTFRGRTLVEAALVTNVPVEIAVQKLRGFVADHKAKVLRTAENELRLEATDQSAGRNRRKEDRPVAFVIDIKLAQEHVERSNAAGLAAGAYVQTNVNVTIRPRRERDRRRKAATERARLMLGSLKSYLMAKEATPEAEAV
ncbi:MAG: diguanylate cyclase [Planctomycetota bacterium]